MAKQLKHKWLTALQIEHIISAESHWMNKLSQCHPFQDTAVFGQPEQSPILDSCISTRKYLFSDDARYPTYETACITQHDQLPIATATFDLCILPHTLERYQRPTQVIHEVYNTLKSEGYLVIFGFNPFGLWRNKLNRKSYQLYLMNTVCKWLMQYKMQLITTQRLLYTLPRFTEKNYHPNKALERYGNTLLPLLGGAYMIVARKNIYNVTPLATKWKWQKVPEQVNTMANTSLKEALNDEN